MLSAITQSKWGFGREDLIFRVDAIRDLQLWRLVTYPFVALEPLGLLLDLLMLWILGGWFETTYGGRGYVRFLFVSSVGAALLAIVLSPVVNVLMPFADLGVAYGLRAARVAILVAFVLFAPDSNMLFGFVLPMRTRTVIYLILGIDIVAGAMTGASTLSITLGGMLMGYLLVTGNWRPGRLKAKLQLWRLRRHRRRGLYVVPPRDRDQTLN